MEKLCDWLKHHIQRKSYTTLEWERWSRKLMADYHAGKWKPRESEHSIAFMEASAKDSLSRTIPRLEAARKARKRGG